MIELGRWNDLEVSSVSLKGYNLTEGTATVWMDRNDTPRQMQQGEKVRVFVMPDRTDGQLIGSSRGPKLQVGEFGVLQVADTNEVGAFLSWGLERDLLLPYRQQLGRPQKGDWTFVAVVVDDSGKKVIATNRWHKQLWPIDQSLRGIPFKGVIAEVHHDRVDVVVDGKYWGVMPISDVAVGCRIGDKVDGTVRSVRNNFLALGSSAAGLDGLNQLIPKMLDKLRAEGGFLGLTDSSSPESIRRLLNMSKSNYKKVVGRMQKEGLIEIEYHGIRLKKPTRS